MLPVARKGSCIRATHSWRFRFPMHPSKFGDSYDIVKQTLLHWLSACGTWAAHPMFTTNVSPSFAEEFSSFLGVPLVTTVPLAGRSGRNGYFRETVVWRSTDHLFLDSDTGLALPQSNAGSEHLMAKELVEIANGRPGKLTLVFDQSFPRGKDEARRRQTREKLTWLRVRSVYGLVYYSHANFVLVSSDDRVLNNAKRTLKEASRLPSCRLIEV